MFRFRVSLLIIFFVAGSSLMADEGESNSVISEGRRAETGEVVHAVSSSMQAEQTEIRVLLPNRLVPLKKTPVVYVLPVEANREARYGDGLEEIRIQKLHEKYNAIFVAPTFSHLPWYANHPEDLKISQEMYFLEVVVPFVEETYPAISEPEGRLLLGFSKSGWGAWTLLLRHPETFGRAVAWDAPMMMSEMKYGSAPIFGTLENFNEYHVPTLLKNRQQIFATDQPRLILTGMGNFESDHQRVHRLLNDLKIPHVYRDHPKRKHDWHSGWVEEAVELLLSN